MRPCRWREALLLYSVRTRRKERYAAFSRSGATLGSSFDSYVPAGSMIRRSPSTAVPSPRRNPLAVPNDLLQEKFTGAIRRTNERSCRDVGESHRFTGDAQFVEHLRGNVLLDHEVPTARPKVLAHGHDVHLVRPEVSHRCEDFLSRLAESEHDRGLREEIGPDRLRGPEDFQTLRVDRASIPDRPLQSLDGLAVVAEAVDTGIDDGAHRVEVSLEIRDQRLDEHVRTSNLDFSNRLREVGGAAVREVVPIHGREDDIGQVHLS